MKSRLLMHPSNERKYEILKTLEDEQLQTYGRFKKKNRHYKSMKDIIIVGASTDATYEQEF